MGLLTEEHQEIRRTVREFVEREVVPIADKLDNEEKEIPMPVIRKMAELGYFGLIFPAEYGGMGLDTLSMAIVTEELSRGWLSVGSVMTRMIITGTLVMTNGTEEQKRRFLPRCAAGAISAFLLTEPDVGSDPARMQSTATPTEDGSAYLLDGVKLWTTNGVVAELLVVMARVPAHPGGRGGISAFVVEPSWDGYAVGKEEKKMGLRSSNTAEIVFRDLAVPTASLLGQEGKGLTYALGGLEHGRLGIAAQALGIAGACLDLARDYCARGWTDEGTDIYQHLTHSLKRYARDGVWPLD